jgi:aspartate carbamoyltransferase catalytic subunit
VKEDRGPAAKDLLGLRALPAEEILAILGEAERMRGLREAGKKTHDLLVGRTVCLLFFEASTRTMNAFDVAARRLSGSVVRVTAGASSSVSKGETLLDTARNLQAIGADIFVVRHGSSGAPQRLAAFLRAGVVNAGDGRHEHPSQALLDMFTLRERFGELGGLEVGIVGDIMHSRVARSNLFGLTACGAKVTLVAPPAWMPKGVEALGARISHDLDEVMPRLDAVMALRIQKERLGRDPGPTAEEYARAYGLTAGRMSRAKGSCVVLHPGPINRGVEMTGEVADSTRSLVLRQVENGVFVRMAIFARSARGLKMLDPEETQKVPGPKGAKKARR